MASVYGKSKIFKDGGFKFLSTDKLPQVYTYGEKGMLGFSLGRRRGDVRDSMEADFSKLDMEGATDVELLDWSITKWKYLLFVMRVKKETVWDNGYKTCALCRVYLKDQCMECPIRKDTGKGHCAGTPYMKYARFKDSESDDFYEDVYGGADHMLDYLVDLKNKTGSAKHMHTMHSLRFYNFVKSANAVGSDNGKTTVKCEECYTKFPFEYERIEHGFDIQLYSKFTDTHFRFIVPLSISGSFAVGVS